MGKTGLYVQSSAEQSSLYSLQVDIVCLNRGTVQCTGVQCICEQVYSLHVGNMLDPYILTCN